MRSILIVMVLGLVVGVAVVCSPPELCPSSEILLGSSGGLLLENAKTLGSDVMTLADNGDAEDEEEEEEPEESKEEGPGCGWDRGWDCPKLG
ncbi:MAG: hypothetical protein AB1646_16845 [Thermodesulfobacteriota bacterium]